MLHIFLFTLVGAIVAYACIAFRDDPYGIDPWEDLPHQNDSRIPGRNLTARFGAVNLSQQISENSARDGREVTGLHARRVANDDGRQFAKAAL